MNAANQPPLPMEALRQHFGSSLQENVNMANYTTARVGGTADALLIVNDNRELETACRRLWEMDVPMAVLGSASNVLISDAGVRGVVVINRAHGIRVNTHADPPCVWAESGANLGGIARQLALRGLSGMEWAATIPGTVGGAAVNNAGAHDGNMQSSLIVAEILHRESGKALWSSDQFGYGYRSSLLKGKPGKVVILTAQMRLSVSTPEAVKARMSAFNTRRRETQPPGASLGSMFKNPPGDYAGRLIEAAGIKGARIGGVEISTKHANFFINVGGATAADFWKLIQLTRNKVQQQFGVTLELEVETLGEWQPGD